MLCKVQNSIKRSYPDILIQSDQDARLYLENLTSKYLYKDVLEFEMLKHANLLTKLLQLLALQLGHEVSKHELAVSLQVSRKTIERYLDLLEKSFVIFRLGALSRNPIHLRTDIGDLWENFCIVERMKLHAYENSEITVVHRENCWDYLLTIDDV